MLTLGAGGNRILATLDTSPLAAGSWRVAIRLTRVSTDEAGDSDAERDDHDDGNVYEGESPPIEVTPRPFAAGDDVAVTLKRTAVPPTPDQALWVAIRNSTNALGFEQLQPLHRGRGVRRARHSRLASSRPSATRTP